MYAIWKFPLQAEPDQTIEMPYGAKIIAVQSQNDVPHIWAECSVGSKMVTRRFRVIATGEEVDSFMGTYLGTVQIHAGMFIFHIYEL